MLQHPVVARALPSSLLFLQLQLVVAAVLLPPALSLLSLPSSLALPSPHSFSLPVQSSSSPGKTRTKKKSNMNSSSRKEYLPSGASSTVSTAATATTISTSDGNDSDNNKDYITILGFGSLLSENSSRFTFPDLRNFRLGRLPNYRRVFGHPTSLFFRRGIANPETLELSSLSVEYAPGHSLIVSVFEVSSEGMMEDGIPSADFLEREEEFDIVTVPYEDFFVSSNSDENDESRSLSEGIVCTKSTDEAYLKRWGEERFQQHFGKYGIDTIWNWKRDSKLRPCAVYFRHCYLAAKSMGPLCFESFLDETYLVDRATTVRQYLQQHPEVLDARPPPDLESRYCG